MTDEKPWQDEDVLRELYYDEQMSMQEIADHFGDLTWGGIKYWMEKHDLDRRSRSESAHLRWLDEQLVMYTHSQDGYEIITPRDGDDRLTVMMHRLLAVHKYGFKEVKGKVVHHNAPEADRSWGIPWDNRPDAIELVAEEEHARIHQTGHHDDEPWHDEDLLRELRIEKGMTLGEMADRLGCSDTTVWRSLRMYRIEGGGEEATA